MLIEATKEVASQEKKTSIPTVTTESVLTTSVIVAKQERDITSMDIPKTFVKIKVQDDDITIMKIRGALVNMLLEINPEKCRDFVIGEVQNKVLHVRVLKALHVMLMANVL